MRILIDILHPAHVHFFRNAINQWSRTHQLLITSRAKDITASLLDSFELPHTIISKQRSGYFGLGGELIYRDLALLKIAKQFKPDVITGVAGVCAAHVSKVLKIPSVIFYDTEGATLINKLTHPFATTVHTPDCYSTTVSGDHRRYAGFHELAYLHPNRFSPEIKHLKPLHSLPGSYFILRFVNHSSSHDRWADGLSNTEKLCLVRTLSSFGKVFISSEAELTPELQSYKLTTKPEVFHHVLANSRMVIGESATVCSEAAMLGVPSIYLSFAERGYISELSEKYGLVRIFSSKNFNHSLKQLEEILEDSQLSAKVKSGHEAMLRDKIDLTDYIIRAVEENSEGQNFNTSVRALQANG